jgi:hypothetical protein
MNERLEQTAHFILLGIGLGFVFGPFAVPLYLIRELSGWWLPWPFKGQWPPGKPFKVVRPAKPPSLTDLVSYTTDFYISEVTQLDRVEDLRRDLIWTLSGFAVGQLLQIGGIIWLLR